MDSGLELKVKCPGCGGVKSSVLVECVFVFFGTKYARIMQEWAGRPRCAPRWYLCRARSVGDRLVAGGEGDAQASRRWVDGERVGFGGGSPRVARDEEAWAATGGRGLSVLSPGPAFIDGPTL